MSDTIVRNSAPTVPIAGIVLISGYAGPRAIENILHPQLAGSGHNITYRPTRLRAGTLKVLFANHADAWAAVNTLATPYNFTLTADVGQLSMTFALRPGALEPVPDIGTNWVLSIPFQEL